MSLSVLSLFMIWLISVGSDPNNNNGHFMVLINPYLSFILCSETKEENKNSQLKLVNINDVFDNPICVKSSQFDLSSYDLFFESTTNTIKKLKTNKNHKPNDERIKLISIPSSSSSNVYHLTFKNSYITIEFIHSDNSDLNLIPFSPNTPSLILSDKNKLNFTFVSVPLFNHKYDETPNNNNALPLVDKMPQIAIGQRVKINNKVGIIMNIITGVGIIQFNDGTVGYYNNTKIKAIRYPIGSEVDAYWPADRLKLTNLGNVIWPATITNYSNISDSYTVKYADGAIHPSIPSIYIFYPQKACMDDRNDCHILAKNQQCQLNPSFAMIHCRKSCRVCKSKSNDDNNNDIKYMSTSNSKYFNIEINNLSLIYSQDLTLDSYDEARKLNEMGEKLILYGNASIAEQYFLRSSFLGNHEAKFNLAHIYTTSQRQDMAVLYLYFSSLSGLLQSNLALGYRHLYGYGVPKSCQIAAEYYEKAGNTLFGDKKPFDSLNHNIEMIRLYDVNRRDLPMEETDEVIRFYHSHADNGDANAQMALGQLYYYGLRGFKQNFNLAMNYFDLASAQNHGDAYAMLGNIYVDGIKELKIAKNIPKAIGYYKKAISLKSISGHTGMAFIYLEDEKYKNNTAAFEYFKYAAKRQDLSAIFYLGLMYFNGIGTKQKKKSFADAFECFMTASRRGHPQSLYYAGYMHLNGLVTAKSCKMAVDLFKMAAERTHIAKELSVARSNYLNNNYDEAFFIYSKLSIQGFEIAQSNVGWLLKRNLVSQNMLLIMDNDTNGDDHEDGDGDDNGNDIKQISRKTAFKYFEWSATQNNADSQRIVGDYYYYNYLQTSSNNASENISRFEEAGIYYEMSAENTLGPNAQSMFNLGYMHQYGIGKKKDFSMAKRYYDLSLSTGPNGNVACYIYLTLLYLQGFVNDIDTMSNTYLHLDIKKYFNQYDYSYFNQYAKDLNVENIALIILIIILIILLWIRH